MAILQALLALLTKSAGKILNAIFGWAVHALFGQTTPRQQAVLSALVGAAVAWPLLLAGVVAPKIAALLIAFVPIPGWVPSWIVRLVWLALVLIVPVAVGIAVTAKAPPTDPPESAVKRFARGFPITLGLATAFLIMFVSVPVMRLLTLLRGRKSADVPLIVGADAYRPTAVAIAETLNRHGFDLHAALPSWWVRAPMRVLRWFGGNAFRRFVPDRIEHFESSSNDLAVSFYASGVLLRGAKQRITRAHGLICEDAAHRDCFLTTDPTAQDLEKQIRRVWRVYQQEPEAHRASTRLLQRVGDIARELGTLDVEYDDWQVVYRQILQLERAVNGARPLLDTTIENEPAKEAVVASDFKEDRGDAARLSNAELIKEITDQVGVLAKKHIELAQTELRADLKAEVAMIGGLGLGALAGIVTINLLLVTAILALAQVIPAWVAGLLASAFTLGVGCIAALVGWNKRVRVPLQQIRRTLKEDARWTKERMA